MSPTEYYLSLLIVLVVLTGLITAVALFLALHIRNGFTQLERETRSERRH